MADQVAAPAGAAGRSPPVNRTTLLIAALLFAVIGAFWAGTNRTTVSIHTAVPSSAERAISIETDGWTYNVPLENVEWVDAAGSWHDGGRPECLPPTGTTRPVTFGAVEVTIQNVTWRPVVWVDCR